MIKWGMKKRLARQNGGFTLVELLIVVAIIAVLSGAAYIGIQRSQARGMNQRMADDLSAIVSALEQFKQDKGHYPNMEGTEGTIELGKDKNVNCFNADTTYAHDCATAEFIQTQVDNTLLTKRYLQEVPTDPRTSSRYAYGVTVDGKFFEVAGNWQNDDGTYTAKVVGNTDKGYSMPSLIRAYDGPNFVMDNEGYLPYSPDHLAITARLDEITGGTVTVTVDGVSTPATAGTVLKAGSKVKTDTGTAVLYFSDGSVTYLDPNTELWVLPNAKVEQNNKDGIITKIRLKIFSGKIWSKVARLASKSEFNVETTGAIAGVRGTEFGIDAEMNELIVLSGSVAARRMTTAEYTQVGGADKYINPPFDSTDTSIFTTAQIAAGVNNGTTFTKFTLNSDPGKPFNSSAPLSLADETAYKGSYYKGAFNNNYRPRILKIDTALVPPVIVFRYLDGVHKIHAVKADGTTVYTYPSSSVTIDPNKKTMTVAAVPLLASMGPIRFYFEDANQKQTNFSDPAIEIAQNLTLTEADIYNMLAVADGGGQPQPCTGIPDSITVAGGSPIMVAGSSAQFNAIGQYSNPPCTGPVTSQCAWSINPPSGGIISPTGNLQVATAHSGPLDIICALPPKTGQYASNVLKQLQSVCYGPDLTLGGGDDEGYWEDAIDTCWVLGGTGEKCSDACISTLPPGAGQCDNGGGWNDDTTCTVCKALIGGPAGACSFSSFARAPLLLGSSTCRYRQGPASSCTITPNVNEKRICACIGL